MRCCLNKLSITKTIEQIEEMLIRMDTKQALECMKDLVATFPHLTRKLNLVLYGGVGVDLRRFCRKLKKEIINFGTSKLQTQVIYIFITIVTRVFFKENLWDRSQILWARENHLDSIVS